MRSHLERLVRKDSAIKHVLKDRNRADPDLVADALEALDRLVPPRDKMVGRDGLSSLQDDIARTRGKTADVFHFADLKRIVSNLDWYAATRMSRDEGDAGSRQEDS